MEDTHKSPKASPGRPALPPGTAARGTHPALPQQRVCLAKAPARQFNDSHSLPPVLAAAAWHWVSQPSSRVPVPASGPSPESRASGLQGRLLDVHPCASLCVPVHSCASLCVPVHPCVSLCIPVCPCASLCVPACPVHVCVSLCILWPCSLDPPGPARQSRQKPGRGAGPRAGALPGSHSTGRRAPRDHHLPSLDLS